MRLRMLATTVAATLLTATATSATAALNTPASVKPLAPAQKTITLITGDVVTATVDPSGRIAASTTSGAGHILETVDEQVYLIPNQAAPYVTAGAIDRQLFNLTKLIADGYDDKARSSIPLIVSYKPGVRPTAGKGRALPSIGAQAIGASKKDATTFWHTITGHRQPTGAPALISGTATLSDGIAKVWLDGQVHTSLDTSAAQIGAPAAWQAGYTGKGVTVAVLDTGIADHPDLAGKVTEARDFTGSPSGIQDRVGHGTHVASTIVGTGTRYRGIAPDGKLLVGKVLGDNGSGAESAIIAGMEWAASKAPIVSMSLGSALPTDGRDPLSTAVNRLTAQTGALFVVASGNNGQRGPRQVSAPAAADAALAVGAVSKDDALAPFSSAGPRLRDDALKPEITAPGVGIVAARVAGTPNGDREPVGDAYARLSGTSMATPHVAGAAALALQQHPDWTATQLKAALTSTSTHLPGLTAFQQGAGRLDVARTTTQRIHASTGTLSLGYFPGPYGAVDPVVRDVTYRNDTAEPVALDLALDARSDKPAGPDLLNVEPSSVTVPANATASARITLDVNHGDLGLYSGALTAIERGGPTRLRTAIAFHKDRVYTVALRAIARDGRPAPGYAVLHNQTTGQSTPVTLNGGTGTIGIRDTGAYSLAGFVSTMDPANRVAVEQTTVARPDLTITGDTELVLDARLGKPVSWRLADEVAPFYLAQGVYRKTAGGKLIMQSGAAPTVRQLFAIPSETATSGEFEYTTRAWLEAPLLRARIGGTRLDISYQGAPGTAIPHLDGHRQLTVVDVGAGRPEDYAGRNVRNRIALIAQTPGLTSREQIATAAANGAVASLIHGREPGVFRDNSVREAPIPPLQLDYDGARTLLAALKRGHDRLDVRATATSPYVYQLVHPEAGRIPATLAYRPTKLAQHRSTFHAAFKGQVGAYSVFASRPYDIGSVNPINMVPLPHRHTRYVVGDGVTKYGEFGWTRFPDQATGIFALTYQPSEKHTEAWFKGPLAPGVTRVHYPVSRNGKQLLLNFGEFHDSDPDHALVFYTPVAESRLYENGVLIDRRAHANGTVNVPATEAATYRVELDVTEAPANWRIATESHSAWTFRSAPTTGWTPLPVVNNVWDLDLDGDNATPAGRPFVLKLRPGTQPGATAVPITDVKLWVSYDHGRTWCAVPHVRGADGAYRALIRHPRMSQTDGFVALRLRAADADGNQLDQTLLNAYALK